MKVTMCIVMFEADVITNVSSLKSLNEWFIHKFDDLNFTLWKHNGRQKTTNAVLEGGGET